MVEEKLPNGDSDPHQLLKKCIKDGRVDIVRSMLQQLAKGQNYTELIDGQLADFDGTLLHYAVFLGSVDSVRALLSSGANPCVQNNAGKTAVSTATTDALKAAFFQELIQAIATSNLGRVCQLIAAGVNVNGVDSPQSGNTPLHYAASFATDEIARTLVESGANVNAQNSSKDTPLHDAVSRKSESISKILLNAGADGTIKNNDGKTPMELAEVKAPELVSTFSLTNVAHTVIHRSPSEDSLEFDRCSILSTDTAPLLTDTRYLGKIESWTDLLWPQPHFIRIDPSEKALRFPTDGRLKVYFDGCGDGEPRRMMQVVQTFVSYLKSIELDIEYRGHKVPDSPLEGRIMCGIFEDSDRQGSYTLDIGKDGMQLMANDYAGIRHGFATLVQILRIFKISGGRRKLSSAENFAPNLSNGHSNGSSTSLFETESLSVIPCLTIRDYPDLNIRAVYQDFSGCKMLNIDTILQLVNRLSYCKANYFFVNFEVRTTDRYQLPYTNRDFFHMTQICEELFVKLVPSLDIQTNSVEIPAVRKIVDSFLDDFPLTRIAHFGPNITSILVQNMVLLESIQKRIPRIFLSVDEIRTTDTWVNTLPAYVTLCVDGKYPFQIEEFISPTVNLVLKFPTTDVGYLCASPETTAKNAVLATQLCGKSPIRGIMICDNSNGCEIMPPSMSLMPECACIGAAWNRTVDIKRFAFLLPRITAEHFLLDGNLVILLEQAANIGRVEHELTKFSCGLGKFANANGDSNNSTTSMSSSISVFVEIILNPENIQLKRLTASIFKKARIELQRSMKALRDARSAMRYEQYELALILAEIQLVTELMTLVSKIGQFLCFYGTSKKAINGGESNPEHSAGDYLGFQGFGVSKLPQATRTDLANSLLEIRRKFQHTWMCRNLAYTLPNALKMFDNLFKALLPPGMQEYEKIL